MAKLTEKQKRFVEEYLIDLNATQAAIRAGYSVKTANEQGNRLLVNVSVKVEIDKAMAERSKRTHISQDRVLHELACIAFSDGSNFAKVIEKPVLDKKGRPVIDSYTCEPQTYGEVKTTPTDDLPPEVKKAIAGIKQTKYGIEVNSYDKLKALGMLGEHLGMFKGEAKQESKENNLFDTIRESTKDIDYGI